MAWSSTSTRPECNPPAPSVQDFSARVTPTLVVQSGQHWPVQHRPPGTGTDAAPAPLPWEGAQRHLCRCPAPLAAALASDCGQAVPSTSSLPGRCSTKACWPSASAQPLALQLTTQAAGAPGTGQRGGSGTLDSSPSPTCPPQGGEQTVSPRPRRQPSDTQVPSALTQSPSGSGLQGPSC